MTGRKNGNYSRRKGSRAEYLVRDIFRSRGYEAHRVPASGAAQGFKGDVEVTTPFEKLRVEVKSRKNEFKWLYDYLSLLLSPYYTIRIGSYTLIMGKPRDSHIPIAIEGPHSKIDKMYNKYIGECDMLVVKNDRKPPIFIRRLDGAAYKEDKLSERNT